MDTLTNHSPDMGRLMKALGLGRGVVAFQLTAEPGLLPEVRVRREVQVPIDAEMKAFEEVSENFVLVLKSELETIKQRHAPVEHVAEETKGAVAIIHVDGSLLHVEWLIPMPNSCHMPVYATPSAASFKRIDQYPPPPRKYVEVVRHSGYTTTPYEILTAQWDPTYKGWTDPGNTRITESGDDPLWWRELPDLSRLP